jgi:hypothetical protein
MIQEGKEKRKKKGKREREEDMWERDAQERINKSKDI